MRDGKLRGEENEGFEINIIKKNKIPCLKFLGLDKVLVQQAIFRENWNKGKPLLLIKTKNYLLKKKQKPLYRFRPQ